MMKRIAERLFHYIRSIQDFNAEVSPVPGEKFDLRQLAGETYLKAGGMLGSLAPVSSFLSRLSLPDAES